VFLIIVRCGQCNKIYITVTMVSEQYPDFLNLLKPIMDLLNLYMF